MRTIDADELKEELELSKYIIPNDMNRLLNSEINRCIEAIDNAPTVEYPFYQEAYQTGYEEGKNERPQGEWIIIDKYSDDYKCSVCNSYPLERGDYPELSKFCPACGAKMEMPK